MKKREYDVIYRRELKILIKTVESYLAAGWVCIGGICVTQTQSYGSTEFYQAMVRTKDSS